MPISFTDYQKLEEPFANKFSEDPAKLLRFLSMLDLGHIELPVADILKHYSTIWAEKRKTQCDLYFNSWSGFFQFFHFCTVFGLWKDAQDILQKMLQGRFSPKIGQRLHSDNFPDQDFFFLLQELQGRQDPLIQSLVLGLSTLLANEDQEGHWRMGFFSFLWRGGSLIPRSFLFPKNALFYAPRGKNSAALPSPSGSLGESDPSGMLFELCNSIVFCTLDQTLETIAKIEADEHPLSHGRIILHALDLLDQLDVSLQRQDSLKMLVLREVLNVKDLENTGTLLAPVSEKISAWRTHLKSLMIKLFEDSSHGFRSWRKKDDYFSDFIWTVRDPPAQERYVDQELLTRSVDKIDVTSIAPNSLHRNMEILAVLYASFPNLTILNKFEAIRSQMLSLTQTSYQFFTSTIMLISACLTNGNHKLFAQYWQDFQARAEMLTPQGQSIIADLMLSYLNTQNPMVVSHSSRVSTPDRQVVIEELCTIYDWTARFLHEENWWLKSTEMLFPLGLVIAQMKRVSQNENPEHHLTILLNDLFLRAKTMLEQRPVKYPSSSVDIVKILALWLTLFVDDEVLPTLIEELRPRHPQMVSIAAYKNTFCQKPLPLIKNVLDYSKLTQNAFDFFTHYSINFQNYTEMILFMGVVTQFCFPLTEEQQQICFNLGSIGDVRTNLNSLQFLNILCRCQYKSRETLWEGI